MRLYLGQMARVPLLTRGEEVDIARRIEDALADADRLRQELADDADPEQAARIEEAERRAAIARSELIRANLRLVVSIAKRYANRGLPLLDLIQEGNIGLMRAVEKFEWRRGYKFSTYATWWVRQAVSRSLADSSRTIRVPVHMLDLAHRTYAVTRVLVQELGREPNAQEIATRMELPVRKVRQVLSLSRQPISLDAPLGDDGDGRFGDVIPDADGTDPSDEADDADLARNMSEVLAQLGAREEKILRMRFGIGVDASHTLQEVGVEFEVTRERIRQIENRALNALKTSHRASKLRSFL